MFFFTFVCEDLLVCLQLMWCRQAVLKLVQNPLSFYGNQWHLIKFSVRQYIIHVWFSQHLEVYNRCMNEQ